MQRIEREANEFASAFLMPKESLLGIMKRDISIDF